MHERDVENEIADLKKRQDDLENELDDVREFVKYEEPKRLEPKEE